MKRRYVSALALAGLVVGSVNGTPRTDYYMDDPYKFVVKVQKSNKYKPNGNTKIKSKWEYYEDEKGNICKRKINHDKAK